jgi:hypothetical protein
MAEIALLRDLWRALPGGEGRLSLGPGSGAG